MTAEGEKRVHRRRVLFIPGFDPRKPVTYHQMWVEEAAAQGSTVGPSLSVGKRRTAGPHGLEWPVQTTDGGRRAETTVTLMRWDDIVRQLWVRGDVGAIRQTPFWTRRFASSGVYGGMKRDARPLYRSMLFPPVLLGGLVLLMLLIAGVGAVVNVWLGLALLAALPFGVLAGWRWTDRRLGTNWLIQCFTYVCRTSAAMPPEQDARCRVFADRILEAEQEDVDEVLLVGFSLGANLAIRALGLALADRPGLGQGQVAVNLLTVGQSLNVYARLPGDPDFLDHLKRVGAATAVGWVDATSTTDPATACKVHPLQDVAPFDPARPVRKPPRFHQVLTPERFRAVRRDPNAFHFQYLRAVDLPGGYDWFRLVAGVRPLPGRSRA